MTLRTEPALDHPDTAAIYAHVHQQARRAGSDRFAAAAEGKTPGEVALLYFGPGWTVLADAPCDIPAEHRSGSTSLTYNTLLLSNEQAWATTNVLTADQPDPERMYARAFRWQNCTGLQRSNQVAAAVCTRTVYGVSPAHLFTALSTVVDQGTHGSDPTTWVHAAHLLNHLCPAEDRPDLDASAFLAALGTSRFAALFAA